MITGLPIQVADAPVSRKLLRTLPQIQEILRSWWPALKQIEVQAESVTQTSSGGTLTGTFFSGGVDSFYTLLSKQPSIHRLVLVRGFDIRPSQRGLWIRTRSSVRQVARAVKKPSIEVETNVREFLDQWAHWEFTHGAALASVAYILAPTLRNVLIPASHSFADQFPWGSHPMLDHLWSVEGMTVVHDGSAINRAERVAAISSSQLALDHLRVCWRNPGGAYNCGKCEKCLRTMLSLYAAGALSRASTLPRTINLAALRRIKFAALGLVAHGLETVEALERAGADKRLDNAIRRSVVSYSETERLWEGAFWNSFHRGGTYADRRRRRIVFG
jgi:hypothetical protein